MAYHEKEQPAKIYCLFHQKIDCSCIAPVTDDKTLKMRLAHRIRLNSQLNWFKCTDEERQKRDEQTILLESRLADMKDL
jgi:hypothetical protein